MIGLNGLLALVWVGFVDSVNWVCVAGYIVWSDWSGWNDWIWIDLDESIVRAA